MSTEPKDGITCTGPCCPEEQPWGVEGLRDPEQLVTYGELDKFKNSTARAITNLLQEIMRLEKQIKSLHAAVGSIRSGLDFGEWREND